MLAYSLLLAVAALCAIEVNAQNASDLPSSFPAEYPGIPNNYSDFSDSHAWQKYFLVKDPLPNVTFPLTRSYAGNIPVDREGHPNNTLFFWAFEKTDGSLTCKCEENPQEPWLIWLNGGPGSSSLVGLLFENGPIRMTNDFSLEKNEYAWNTLADAFWVDQPVGTGYSTVDSNGYIRDEEDMAQDFLRFVENLVKVFPCLKYRPLYLTGESYAGTYIPYILKAYFSTPNPPFKMAKIAIGDGTISGVGPSEELGVMSIMETYPQLIDYDKAVYEYFKEQIHLCGYDLSLTYPQDGPLPTLRDESEEGSESFSSLARGRLPTRMPRRLLRRALARSQEAATNLSKRELSLRQDKRADWKRDLSQRPNGTIDPFYECFVLFELLDYAVNFTLPWSRGENSTFEPGFDVYNIPDALDPEAPTSLQDPSVFLNDPRTREALHAPTSRNWTRGIDFAFGNNPEDGQIPGTNVFGDPSAPPIVFLSELAANSSANNVSWVVYSGNDDFLVSHVGTEVTIQNTTFGGIQGFTCRPATAWYADDNEFAGIVHQERNITYVLFDKSGHLVPQLQPQRALTFLREFVLGSNPNGTVVGDNCAMIGDSYALKGDILPGEHNPIFTGSGTTMGSTLWPSATIAAWDSFIATATATAGPV